MGGQQSQPDQREQDKPPSGMPQSQGQTHTSLCECVCVLSQASKVVVCFQESCRSAWWETGRWTTCASWSHALTGIDNDTVCRSQSWNATPTRTGAASGSLWWSWWCHRQTIIHVRVVHLSQCYSTHEHIWRSQIFPTHGLMIWCSSSIRSHCVVPCNFISFLLEIQFFK